MQPGPKHRTPGSPEGRRAAGISPRLRKFLLAIFAGASLGLTVTVVATQWQNLPLRDGYRMQNGDLLGGDFIAFYTAGKLYRMHPERLYDLGFQSEFRDGLLGPASSVLQGELPFVYPPLVAAALSFPARLPFATAFLVTAILAVSSVMLITWRVGRAVGYRAPLHSAVALLALAGFVPFSVNTVLGGQLSWVGMIVLGGVFWALKTDRPMLAGLVMSLSYYKPPLFLFALVVLVLTQGRRFIGGFALGATLLVSMTTAAVGTSGLTEFLRVASRYLYGQELMQGVELPPESGAGVYGLLTVVSSGNGPLAAASLAAIFAVSAGLLVYTGRNLPSLGPDSGTLWLAGVWVASVGLSVQCIRYDLALLFVPLMALVASRRRVVGTSKILIGGCLAGFYWEFLVRKTMVWGYTINLSSVLFLILIPACLAALVRQRRSEAHAR